MTDLEKYFARMDKKAKKSHDRLDYIFTGAVNDEGMKAKETVQFHYLNKNGLLKKLDILGSKGFDDYSLTSGIFASDFYEKELTRLMCLKKPRWIDINVIIMMLKDECDRWEEKIAKCEKKYD